MRNTEMRLPQAGNINVRNKNFNLQSLRVAPKSNQNQNINNMFSNTQEIHFDEIENTKDAAKLNVTIMKSRFEIKDANN